MMQTSQKLWELLMLFYIFSCVCLCVHECECVFVYHPILLQNSTHQTALLGPSSHNSSLQQSTPYVRSSQALEPGQHICGENHLGVM